MQSRVVTEAAGLEDGAGIPAPAVFIFSQWIRDLSYRADLLAGTKAAYTPSIHELLDLWAEAIRSCERDIQEDECYALARQARAADRLLAQWVDEPAGNLGGHYWKRFLRWRKTAHYEMRDKNWFTAEDWFRHCQAQLQTGTVVQSKLPESIELAGFAEITRLEQSLLDALAHAGVAVRHQTRVAARSAQVSVRHYASLEHEISSMARWALSELQAGRTRVAVIINDLDGLHERVSQVFEDTFHPDRVLGLEAFDNGLFHLSRKPALASHPLVRQALDLLGISISGPRRPLDFSLISRLLLANNWLGAEAEGIGRAGLELQLRQMGWYRVSLAALAELASRQRSQASMPLLVRLCSTLEPPSLSKPAAQQLMDWLVHWGWPGEQCLDATAASAATQLLDGLRSVSLRSINSVSECLQGLRRWCEEATTNLHGGAFSPVQILSPAEAIGQEFDSAWAGNLSDNNWPGRGVGNAFIPASLLKMIPRASDSGMLAYTETLMQGIAGCSENVILSGANRFEDVPQGVSPLLAELPLSGSQKQPVTVPLPARPEVMLSLSSLPGAGNIADYRNHPWLEAQFVTTGFRLCEAEYQPLHGAVRRFNYQSACPLAAYLVFRLNARMQEPPVPFVDAAFRGRLLHAALERLFRPVIGTADRPHASAVTAAVASALRDEHADTRLMPASLEAEQVRLRRLLSAWLGQQEVNPGGTPVKLEWQHRLSFDGFEFDVRIDRLDRVANDAVFILDYKAGNIHNPAWARERLEDIQLPLYAVALAEEGSEHPAGVGLLQLKPGDFKAFGISGADDAVCRGVQLAGSGKGSLARMLGDWGEVLSFWGAELRKLAEEIRRGDCRHQLYNEKALRYAGLDILLRSSELRHWSQDHSGVPDTGTNRQ